MPGLEIRPAEQRDVERAGDVNFVAFYQSALSHGVPPVVTTPGESRRYIRYLLDFDPLGGVAVSALRTGAMMARVIDKMVPAAVQTAINFSAQGAGAAGQQAPLLGCPITEADA